MTELSRPSPARVYDYLLGGGAHYAADRAAAANLLSVFPGIAAAIRLNRYFLQKVVRFLAQHGVRQFLDLGAGIPAPGGVYEVAQTVIADPKVVHVDIDPIALCMAEYATRYDKNIAVLEADIRYPETVLSAPELTGLIDPTQPVGVLLLGTPHFLRDTDDPASLLDRYRSFVAIGSYLALSHATADDLSAIDDLAKIRTTPITPRTRDQVVDLMRGFEVIEPGVVHTASWRPEEPLSASTEHSACYVAVGRKTHP